MLAVLQYAVILLMQSISKLITPLGLAQMQMQLCELRVLEKREKDL